MRRTLVVCGLILGLLLVSAARPGVARASGAHLTLSPNVIATGQTIVVYGRGFRPSESVLLAWIGGPLTRVRVSTSGAFSSRLLIVPGTPLGAHIVAAWGNGDSSSAMLTVLGGAPAPTTTLPAAPTSTGTSIATPSKTPTAAPTTIPTIIPTMAPTAPSPTSPATPPTMVPTMAPTAAPSPVPSGNVPTSGVTGNGCPITPAQASAEQHLLASINAHRAAAGAPALTLDATLSVASREHSCDMSIHQALSHTGSDGSSPFQRISATGVTFSTGGENIGMAGGYGLIGGVDTIDSGMMAEPATQGTHHWNIIHAAYTRVGLGIIYANGEVWLTEDFIG